MKYSIIIPTHNRAEALANRLGELEKLNDSEIIVIENNSDYPKKYEMVNFPKNSSFYSIVCPGIGTGEARNVGLAKSRGEYVFFLDDDDAIHPKFIDFLNNATLTGDVYRTGVHYKNKTRYPSFFKKVIKTTKFDEVKPMSFISNRNFLVNNNIKFETEVIHQDLQFNSLVWNTEVDQNIIRVPSISYFDNELSLTSAKLNHKKEDGCIDKLVENNSEFWFLVIENNYRRAKKNSNKVDKDKILSKFDDARKRSKKIFRRLPLFYKARYLLFVIKSIF